MKKIIRIGLSLLLTSYLLGSVVSFGASVSGQTETGIGFVDGPSEPPNSSEPKPKPRPKPKPKPKPGPIRLPQTGEEVAMTLGVIGGLIVILTSLILWLRKKQQRKGIKK